MFLIFVVYCTDENYLPTKVSRSTVNMSALTWISVEALGRMLLYGGHVQCTAYGISTIKHHGY